MEATLVESNTGGRVRFELNTKVRILCLDGTVSTTIYEVDQERSDRNGFILLKDGAASLKVQHRRVLPVSVDGKAVVIASGDRFYSLCPEHGIIVEVSGADETMTCQTCSKTFPLYWLGARPMPTDTATKPKKAPKKQTEKIPKPEKAQIQAKEPIKVDLHALASRENCELWTKKGVKFDHERIDVRAHVLIYTGDSPRKLCFNTYNNTLGKKGGELPIEEFIANTAVKGAKKETPWFAVEDVEKVRVKLKKSGYERAK